MINKFLKTALCCVVLLTALPVLSQDLTHEQLAREGARIGRCYYLATRNNDSDLQADAINQFNEILVTLKKQVQVEILTNAFNNANIPIETPLVDARRYTRALMNAHRSGDSIAIEDAEDIAETVKRIYVAEREESEAADYASLYDATVQCAQLGAKAAGVDSTQYDMLKAEAKTASQPFEADSAKVTMLNDTFDYYALMLTDAKRDAEHYASQMNQLASSGSQAEVDAVSRLVAMVYERYTLERGAEEAKLFITTFNTLVSAQK